MCNIYFTHALFLHDEARFDAWCNSAHPQSNVILDWKDPLRTGWNDL